MSGVITYERRYTGSRGRAAHLIDPMEFRDNHCPTALCGLWAWHSSAWFGSGSQDEHERASALPLCKTCERKAKP